MDKQFFHEITDDQFEELKLSKANWADVAEKFSAPEWCGCGPSALHGMAGCWSLVDREVTGEDFCSDCPEFNGNTPRKGGDL